MLGLRKMEISTGVDRGDRQNVRFDAQKRISGRKKRNLLIAPTICMKTKAKFRQESIAPTILMKISKLAVFSRQMPRC